MAKIFIELIEAKYSICLLRKTEVSSFQPWEGIKQLNHITQVFFAFLLFSRQANRVESGMRSELRKEGINLYMRLQGGVRRQPRPSYLQKEWRRVRVRKCPLPLPGHHYRPLPEAQIVLCTQDSLSDVFEKLTVPVFASALCTNSQRPFQAKESPGTRERERELSRLRQGFRVWKRSGSGRFFVLDYFLV